MPVGPLEYAREGMNGQRFPFGEEVAFPPCTTEAQEDRVPGLTLLSDSKQVCNGWGSQGPSLDAIH